MNENTLVHDLAHFAATSTYKDLPREVQDSVCHRLLDTAGVAIAATKLETSQALMGLIREQGGQPQSYAISLQQRVPAAQAALLNGALAHSLDYDDTHLPSILHPSATVIPTSLAAAELTGTDGQMLATAIAVGLEITVRVGMAGFDKAERNSLFFQRGQHATSICGTVGSAASAALLLGLDERGIANAMSVAVSMASGLLEANRTGGTVKRLHCGWAAHAAMTAAQLAHRGITGPSTVLEGRFGFFEAFLGGRYNSEELLRGLGQSWAVPDIHFKPYPANHFTHTTIDAMMQLRDRGLTADDVDHIQIGVAAPAVRTIGEPIDVKRSPQTGYQAQFSGPYTAVAALLGGGGLGLDLNDFTDSLARDRVRRKLMAMVSVAPDNRCEELYPYELPAVVTVTTKEGEQLVEEVLENRGGPRRPLSLDELLLKFRANTSRSLAPEAVIELERSTLNLSSLKDTTDILALTVDS